MAVEQRGFIISLKADTDIDQYTVVKVSGAFACAKCAAADVAVGVVQNDPKLGQSAAVMTNGISKVTVGAGGLTAGDLVGTDANGKAVKTTSGKVIGIALIDASEGAIGSVLIGFNNGYKAGA